MTLDPAVERHVHILDGFYDDPDAVRALATRARYVDYGHQANFPGLESEKAYHTAEHAVKFADVVGRPVAPDPDRWIFGKFRVATAGQVGRTHVHVDKVGWTAVVHLSSPPVSGGGELDFFAPVMWHVNELPDDFTGSGYRDLDDFDRRFIVPNSTVSDTWRVVGSVPMRYNRCVIFRGARLLHGIRSTYGLSLETGRLTQNFFFDETALGSLTDA